MAPRRRPLPAPRPFMPPARRKLRAQIHDVPPHVIHSTGWSTGWHSFDDLDDDDVVAQMDEVMDRAASQLRPGSVFVQDHS